VCDEMTFKSQRRYLPLSLRNVINFILDVERVNEIKVCPLVFVV